MSDACLKRFDGALEKVVEAKHTLEEALEKVDEAKLALDEGIKQAVLASAGMAEVKWDTNPLDIIDQRVEAAEEREQKRKREN